MDKRLKKLRIDFPDGWVDISGENPEGPPTFVNEQVDDSGVLQISMAEYVGGEVPDPSQADLVVMAKEAGFTNQFGELTNEESGHCNYGIYGCAEFSGAEFSYAAIWYLSDGRNFVFATFISSAPPGPKLIQDVKDVLKSIKKKSFLGSLFK
jgi:hypothetical protein